jgi:hypothetical protein
MAAASALVRVAGRTFLADNRVAAGYDEKAGHTREGIMAQKPVVIGPLLCEQIIVDEKTKYVTPVNCFTYREVEQIPSEPVTFYVLAFLTDGIGDVRIKVLLQRLGDEVEDLVEREAVFRFTDPLHIRRFTVRFRNIAFPSEGKYQITMVAAKELIAQSVFRVYKKGE